MTAAAAGSEQVSEMMGKLRLTAAEAAAVILRGCSSAKGSFSFYSAH
jgi:hypothetical protein